MTEQYANILVERRGRVGLVTLNRPEALNALNKAISPALNVLSNTARVRRFRILSRTSVCPPRAVGLEISTSMQWKGAPSNSKTSCA